MAVIAEETTRSEDTALVGGSVMSGLEFDFDHTVSEIWETEINLNSEIYSTSATFPAVIHGKPSL